LARKPTRYWDACAWIGLIQQEADKIEALRHLVEQAQRGEIEIWTSAFTLAEVYKRPIGPAPAPNRPAPTVGLSPADDKPFEDYIEQKWVHIVQVDSDVGKTARRLLRAYPTIGKPQDAIHVATALLWNIDELHTWDRPNLLRLSGQLKRKDGAPLSILSPAPPPPPKQGSLFDGLNDGKPAAAASAPEDPKEGDQLAKEEAPKGGEPAPEAPKQAEGQPSGAGGAVSKGGG
jgi:predicted nucleic acid-binding protein